MIVSGVLLDSFWTFNPFNRRQSQIKSYTLKFLWAPSTFKEAVVGGLLGGIILLRLGIYRSLWIFGILQAISTADFALLAQIGGGLSLLAVLIVFENLNGGMGTAAYVAYMASLTNKKFTATQFALLSSLMGVPRILASAPTGFMVSALGWNSFFIFCTFAALPGLLLLGWVRRDGSSNCTITSRRKA